MDKRNVLSVWATTLLSAVTAPTLAMVSALSGDTPKSHTAVLGESQGRSKAVAREVVA